MLSPVGVLVWLDGRAQQAVDAGYWALKERYGTGKLRIVFYLHLLRALLFLGISVVQVGYEGVPWPVGGLNFFWAGYFLAQAHKAWSLARLVDVHVQFESVSGRYRGLLAALVPLMLTIEGPTGVLLAVAVLSFLLAAYLHNTPENPPPKKKAKAAAVSSLIPSFQAP